MTGDVVIVTHHAADEPLGQDVARELSHFAAFPMCLSAAKPARRGAGAIGVIVWTHTLALAFPKPVLEQLAHDALIYWTGGAVPASAGLVIEAGASAGEALRRAVAAEQAARSRAREQRGVERVVRAPAAAAVAARGEGSRLAVQTASGLAAALAVIGIAAPMIGGGRSGDEPETTGPTLSLVGEARAAAAGRVTPLSMRTSVLAARPQTESNLPLDALVQTEAHVLPVVLPREPVRNAIQPVGIDPLQVEILSNGEVVSGLDIAPLEYSASSKIVAVEGLRFVDFAVDEGADLAPADGPDINSFPRMMGPPE